MTPEQTEAIEATRVATQAMLAARQRCTDLGLIDTLDGWVVRDDVKHYEQLARLALERIEDLRRKTRLAEEQREAAMANLTVARAQTMPLPKLLPGFWWSTPDEDGYVHIWRNGCVLSSSQAHVDDLLGLTRAATAHGALA